MRVEAERFVNGKRRRDRVWMEQEMEVGVVPSVKPPEWQMRRVNRYCGH